jgi:AcrR family transcriptional regulator
MSGVSLTDATPPNPPVRQRSTRDRPAKSPLSEDAVVDAALAILKADGAEAVTMRRVAAALDTGAASLYVYVAGREGLQLAMLDRVTAEVALESPDPSRWRDQLHALLLRMHDALNAYPGIAAMTLAHPPTTETVLNLAENMMGILLAGGLDAQDAAWACDVLVLLVTAVANEDDVRRTAGRGGVVEDREQIEGLYNAFVALPADRFPNITTYAVQMVAGDSAERFRFAVDVVVDGLVARSTGK